MNSIATFLRFKQLLAHNIHNTTFGPSFFADHAFFGDFYEQASSQYDSVIERMIGLGLPFDLVNIQKDAVKELEQVQTKDNYFILLLSIENELIAEIDQIVKTDKSLSQGTIQLLGDIANQAEINVYKLGQRA